MIILHFLLALPFQFHDSLPMQFIIDPSAWVFYFETSNIKNTVSMKLIIFPLSNIFVAIFVHHYALPISLILYIFFTIVRSWLITLAYVYLLLRVFAWWNFKQIEYVLLNSPKLLFGQVCCSLGVWYENGEMNWCKSWKKRIIHFEFTTSSEYCS